MPTWSMSAGHNLVMATSERSLLTVLLPAVNRKKSLVPNLCEATALLLGHIGVDAQRAAREIEAMREVQFGRTESRSILGSMNDLSRSLEWYLQGGIVPIEAMLRFRRNAHDGDCFERRIPCIPGPSRKELAWGRRPMVAIGAAICPLEILEDK